jgi:hypothetical protein
MRVGGNSWKGVPGREETGRRKNISAAAAVNNSPSAGPAPAAFKSATPAWKKIFGD